MGLDWNPGNKPKPGYEEEFDRLFRQLENVPERTEQESLLQRFRDISISAFETLNTPRVGYSEAADAWAREAYRERSPDCTEQEWLQRLQGFYVLPLVPKCDGIPRYSNGDPGGYVEPYSFRAQFLVLDCEEIIGPRLVEQAYGSKLSREMLAYGNELITKAEEFARRNHIDLEHLDIDDYDGIDVKVDVVLAAGRWCRFWAERGHILDAYW